MEVEGAGVISKAEGPGSPGPVHPVRINARTQTTVSAGMAARDGFMHASFHPERLMLALSAKNPAPFSESLK